MNIILATQDTTVKYWPVISEILERAFEHGQGESSLTDYLRKVLSNTAQCWLIVENNTIVGAGLTEILHYARHKTLHIIVYSGSDFEQQSAMLKPVIEFAKGAGCKSIEQWGRDGWAKVLPKYIPGFKKVYTVMRYDLGDTNEASTS